MDAFSLRLIYKVAAIKSGATQQRFAKNIYLFYSMDENRVNMTFRYGHATGGTDKKGRGGRDLGFEGSGR